MSIDLVKTVHRTQTLACKLRLCGKDVSDLPRYLATVVSVGSLSLTDEHVSSRVSIELYTTHMRSDKSVQGALRYHLRQRAKAMPRVRNGIRVCGSRARSSLTKVVAPFAHAVRLERIAAKTKSSQALLHVSLWLNLSGCGALDRAVTR